MVRLLGNDRVIGCITVEELHPLELEISYLFNVDSWSHGYATESVKAVIDKLRVIVSGHQVIAKTQMANLPSRRLLARLGFHMDQEVVEFGELQAIYSQRL